MTDIQRPNRGTSATEERETCVRRARDTIGVVYLRLGRAYCPSCDQVRVFVADADVTEIVCVCGTLTEPAHQEE